MPDPKVTKNKEPELNIVDSDSRSARGDASSRPVAPMFLALDLSHAAEVTRVAYDGNINMIVRRYEAVTKADRSKYNSIKANKYIYRMLLRNFQEAAEGIMERRADGERIDALNISMDPSSLPIADLRDKDPSMKSIWHRAHAMGIRHLRPDNLKDYRATLRDVTASLFEKGERGSGFAYRELLDSLERLVNSGVKVYVSAGNDGPDDISSLALASGVRSVGATYADGKRTYYSGATSLVTDWAQGSYGLRRLGPGVDITGNGTLDAYKGSTNIASYEAPFIERIIDRIAGRDPIQIRSELPAWWGKAAKADLKPVFEEFNNDSRDPQKFRAAVRGISNWIRRLPVGLYETKALMDAIQPPTRAALPFTETGDYTYLSTSFSPEAFGAAPPRLSILLTPQELEKRGKDVANSREIVSFRVVDGALLYDPERSGKHGQLGALEGTSFSAPMRAATDLKIATYQGKSFSIK